MTIASDKGCDCASCKIERLTAENERLQSELEQTKRRLETACHFQATDKVGFDWAVLEKLFNLQEENRRMKTVISVLLEFLLEDGIPEDLWSPEYKATVHTARALIGGER